jgi:hypothetical protein
LQLQVLINFSDVVGHMRDLFIRLALELLKRLFFALEHGNLKQVVIFKVMQIVDHFLRRLEGNLVVVVAIISVEVNIRGPLELLGLLIFD